MLTDRPFTQSYTDKIRKSGKRSDEWNERASKCAHQILKAACFRQSAAAAFHRAGSVPLAVIGFYYAVFHMELAMLWVDHSSRAEELSIMRHKRLASLVNSKFVETEICPGSIHDILVRLRRSREFVNYQFYVPNKDFRGQMGKIVEQVDDVFENATHFIRKVAAEIQSQFSLLLRIQVKIGDSMGDELYAEYLSKEDKEKVIAYLVSVGMTS